jgi:hypothetical protein
VAKYRFNLMLKTSTEAVSSALEPSCGSTRCAAMAKRVKRRRFLGLKLTRLVEWLNVIDEELQTIGFKELYHMLRGLLRPKVTSKHWRSRIKACHSCPLYDPGLKRCRPYTGSPHGCGCYVPFRLLDPHPCHREESLSQPSG